MTDVQTDRRDKPRTNWLPYLLIPLFFLVGWWSRGAMEDPNNAVESQVQGIEEAATANPTVPGVPNPTFQ